MTTNFTIDLIPPLSKLNTFRCKWLLTAGRRIMHDQLYVSKELKQMPARIIADAEQDIRHDLEVALAAK